MNPESQNRTIRQNRQSVLPMPFVERAAAFLGMCLCFFVISRFFEFRFDLNDDVMIRRIVSGAYTGMPEAHNIQMLYPLGAVLSLLYRLVPAGIDWYGGFLEGAQLVCAAAILGRLLTAAKGIPRKVWYGCIFLLVYIVLYLPHIVFCQYTVVCAMLCGTAAFLLLTGDGRGNQAAVLILLWLAFLVRSEMLLLLLPLVCVSLLFNIKSHDIAQNRAFLQKKIKQYLVLLITLVVGMGMFLLIHHTAYGSEEWRTFLCLFDNRTELYDFQKIPSYEAQRDFYESVGLTESEQALLINYNYGLDESIDAGLLGKVAVYARDIRKENDKKTIDIINKLRDYLYRLRNVAMPDDYAWPTTDAPWNIIVIICYFIVAAAYRERAIIWRLALLLICRSALWGYILVRGRDPIRITHGLYLVEILILTGAAVSSIHQEEGGFKYKITAALLLLACTISCIYIPNVIKITNKGAGAYEEEDHRFAALYDYMDAHPECYYYIDVFSWVPYTETLADGVVMRPANRDIMGGWVCKSPLYERKLAAFGMESMREGLLRDDVFFVQETGKDVSWLYDFYKDSGTRITMTRETEIDTGFTVWRVVQE